MVDRIYFVGICTNITPENRFSQKESSLPTIHFQVRFVSFREGKCKYNQKIHKTSHMIMNPTGERR